jgi:hypothetical protein
MNMLFSDTFCAKTLSSNNATLSKIDNYWQLEWGGRISRLGPLSEVCAKEVATLMFYLLNRGISESIVAKLCAAYSNYSS